MIDDSPDRNVTTFENPDDAEPAEQYWDVDRTYAPATVAIVPKRLWTSVAVAGGLPLLLIVLVAIHPWTFASYSAAPTPTNGGTAFPVGIIGSSGDSQVVLQNPPDSGTDTTESAVPDPATEAAAITTVLQQAQTDRQSVVSAVGDALTCGNLAGDEQALQTAQANRQSLAQSASESQVDALPDASAVPQELSDALTASASADGDFITWIGDLRSSCDKHTTTADPAYQQAAADSKQATRSKQALLGTWNPIAQEYGQPTWSESDI